MGAAQKRAGHRRLGPTDQDAGPAFKARSGRLA